MTLLAVAMLSCLPIYPLNPVRQDTVNTANFHLSAQVTGPNALVTAAPGASLKWEVLLIHPLILRAGAEYSYGQITSRLKPRGNLHTVNSAVELLYYRGTNQLSGFVGAGVFLASNMFDIGTYSRDSLERYDHVVDVDIGHSFGYRVILGLRFDRNYSLEVCFSDSRPEYIYTKRINEQVFERYRDPLRFNDVRVSFGYLLTIREI